MIFKYRFCLWLIDLLRHGPLTFAEIQKKWEISSVNDEGIPILSRSFQRYCHDASSLMYVDIKCDKRTNLYTLSWPDNFKGNELNEWILSAFRVSCLASRVDKHHSIMIDAAPSGSSLLFVMMDAIDKNHPLRFAYRSYYKKVASECEVYPAFVRLFKQRWYLVGEEKNKKTARTFAIERMSDVKMIEDEKNKFTPSLKRILTPDVYFQHCFGVIRLGEPITVRFRAFNIQADYVRSVPIHCSQKEVCTREEYSDFEIFVRPTYDLKQELLWHRDKLAVIAPESFKNEMIEMVEQTLLGYKTGKDHSIDE